MPPSTSDLSRQIEQLEVDHRSLTERLLLLRENLLGVETGAKRLRADGKAAVDRAARALIAGGELDLAELLSLEVQSQHAKISHAVLTRAAELAAIQRAALGNRLAGARETARRQPRPGAVSQSETGPAVPGSF